MNRLLLFADYEALGSFAAAVILVIYGLVLLVALLFKAKAMRTMLDRES